jgi:two-component system sensor histidine kinase KdpD
VAVDRGDRRQRRRPAAFATVRRPHSRAPRPRAAAGARRRDAARAAGHEPDRQRAQVQRWRGRPDGRAAGRSARAEREGPRSGPRARATSRASSRPFYRGRDASDARGAGLGLALCRAIAAAHGGSLGVSRRARGGCRFTLALPVVEQPAVEVPA